MTLAISPQARDALATLQGTTIIATHPRYQYFARAYGLDIAALEWDAGALPDEAQWQDLQDMVAETGASLLIWEAEPPQEAKERAAGMGLASIVFAPLATRPASGDFASVMRAQIEALATRP